MSPSSVHRVLGSVERTGMRLTDHVFEVPLDHANPAGEQLEVYAREVADPAQDVKGTDPEQAPWLVFFQGGPGMAANRPLEPGGWLEEALKTFRVLLLDQRGTGRSTPINRQTLPLRGGTPEQANYLRHFRADSIVADAELIRRSLGVEQWSILGQSFGGFCALTYLSTAPGSLREALITGGLGPVSGSIEDVYRATYTRVKARNEEFYGWYPQDLNMARRVAEHLQAVPEYLPTGERLTVHRFQMLGNLLGGNSRVHQLHFLLEAPFVSAVDGKRLSDGFLEQVGSVVSYAANPLYAVMHESIYSQGPATGWTADRVLAERPDFSTAADPLLFTGEMIHPWYFEEDPALIPLAAVADEVSKIDDWGQLYDLEQLARNEVPAAAAVYLDDIFVAHELSVQTAASVAGLRTWETGDYHHDGLRQDGAVVFARLLSLCRQEEG
ncbi:alpha/beta fold hydrolase [Arthrobacter monumenti]